MRLKAVCDQYGLVVKGKRIEYAEFFQYFSKAIIATDLPGFELIIYLRSREKKEYLKMVQTKEGHFRFERPTPSRVGFFLWIESLQPSLGTKISLRDPQDIHDQGYRQKNNVTLEVARYFFPARPSGWYRRFTGGQSSNVAIASSYLASMTYGMPEISDASRVSAIRSPRDRDESRKLRLPAMSCWRPVLNFCV